MRSLLLLLTLMVISAPVLARPFDYNFSLGPEYFYFSSQTTNTNANLVTCGLICRGNLFKVINAEYRGGFGEISTTKMNFNELSLLYDVAGSPDRFLGFGLSYLDYNNTLDKTNNINVRAQKLNAKVQWEQSVSPLLSFFGKIFGPQMLGYDLGWQAYFGKNNGDFNIVLGYKDLKLNESSSMKGPYIASSVYF